MKLISLVFRQPVELLENNSTANVECKYNNKFKKWEPLKGISENITLSEI